MARKKVLGRSRTITKEHALNVTLERTNKKLKRLYKAKLDNKYAANKLKERLKAQGDFRVVKGRVMGSTHNLSAAQIRYYKKVFNSFLSSPVSTPLGIEQSRTKSRETLKQSLGELADGKEISDEDVDDFYSLFEDEDYTYFSDKIGVSTMYALVNEVQAKNYSESKFIDTLASLITLNTEEVRAKAKRVYEKYVA